MTYTIRDEIRTETTSLDEEAWDGVALRLIAVLEAAMSRHDGMIDGRRCGVKSPDAEAWKQTLQLYQGNRAKVRHALTVNPDARVGELMRECGVSDSVVRRVRAEMGLPPFPNGRGLKDKIIDLIATRPEMTDKDIASSLQCSVGYVKDLRFKMADEQPKKLNKRQRLEELLAAEPGLDPGAIAERIGASRSYVSDRLRVLRLAKP